VALRFDTPLKWAGSKRQLLPLLAQYWPGGTARYIEPFAGSARLFFRLTPHRALLGDVNAELIRTYRELKRAPEEVIAAYAQLRRTRATFLWLRATAPTTLKPAAAAARFLFLNRACFNGLYRTNLAGQFNVPYASPPPATRDLAPTLRLASSLLQSTALCCGDFVGTLQRARKGDFVYLDPPYAVTHRRIFREYNASPFDTSDLSRLQLELKRIDSIGAHFVVSYADTSHARALFSCWYTRRVRARRHIAGFAASRRFAFELLATNIPAEDR
jgi:DNA adenine methylase